MKILFLPSSYLPQTVGGTEMYVHRLSEELAERGHEVTVAFHGELGEGEVSQRYKIVALAPLPPPTKHDLYTNRSDLGPPGFTDLLDAFKPDIAHFHAFTLGAGVAHVRALAARKIPYFITYHVPDFTCKRGTMMKFGSSVCPGVMDAKTCSACILVKLKFPRPIAKLLAHSPFTGRQFPNSSVAIRLAMPHLLEQCHKSSKEFLSAASHIFTYSKWSKETLELNGIASARIGLDRQALGGRTRRRALRLPLPNDRPLRIGWLGRFVHEKGLDILVDASKKLKARGVEHRIELCGKISERKQAWNELIAQSDQVHYLGLKLGDALSEWYQSLDLLVVPSRWMETGPLVVLEAWDQGVPVIGSDLGGIAETLRRSGQESLLFETNNSSSLADAVIRAKEWTSGEVEVQIPGMVEFSAEVEAIYQNSCSSPSNQPQ